MNIRDFTNWYRENDKDAGSSEGQKSLRRELREVRLAFEVDADFDKAIALAEPFLSSSDSELRRQAKKHIALSMFRKQEYREASQLFRELADGSTDAGDWLNVATSATLSGEIAAGEEAFKTALKCQEAAGFSQRPSVPYMRHWYACALQNQEEYDRALLQIEELCEIYKQLHVTDDTYLYNRGMPSFYGTIKVTQDVLRGLGAAFDSEAFIDSLSAKVDEDGKRYLAGVKRCIAAG